MDVLMVYALFASITPLFLWIEYRITAMVQLPFILGMWGFFFIEFASLQINTMMYSTLLAVFILNLIFAHFAFYLVFFEHKNTREHIFEKFPHIARRKDVI
ncbi:spore gernimation protein [Pontibacillus yanchengensis]|uniref:Spore gernimation protein n=2 Tax=Pontibacillus yanchengensis TaxID=462910 RepID=A0A6I4ZYR1_9BACI|nr:spore morphogenesis/germination protein YwcE [Pontibacillus yanchengensis]MYL32962.1 spore gernimation protein [Pontibacillus yanchengensis]MYL52188.1 spore gernimation protein [Pontibacillus yanchengensis]